MKRLYKILNDIDLKKECINDIIEELIPIVDEYDLYNIFSDIAHEDFIDDVITDMIKQKLGWERIKIFLDGVDYFTEYYIINGYGNLKNIDYNSLYCIVADMIDDLKRR